MAAGMNRSEQEALYRQSRELILKAREDLVLSVLKSPLASGRNNHAPSSDDDGVFEDQDAEERRRLNDEASPSEAAPPEEPTGRFNFLGEQLRRLRAPRGPRFGEAHHKRVPTPIKKRRPRYNNEHYARTKSEDDEDEEDEEDDVEDVVETVPGGTGGKRGSGHGPPGVPDPYYPIYLPIDQAFKAKYVFHHKKGKTFQERVYVFLEHPGGWLCFVYHFTV